MSKFKTESGSVYEVDQDQNRIRRLNGATDPTHRQGADGEWKTYMHVSEIKIGASVLIIWGSDVPLLEGSPENSTPTTVTSPVSQVWS